MVNSRKAHGRAGTARAVLLGAAMIGAVIASKATHAHVTFQAEARNLGAAAVRSRLQPDRGSSPTILQFTGPNRTGVAYCTARHVVFSGNNGHIMLRGGCRSLTIQGSNNRVTIEVEAGALIQVHGQHNTIQWHVKSGTQQPKVQDFGRDNIFRTQT